MHVLTWQKSSYCAQGNSCVHVAAEGTRTIRLRESGDPSESILGTTPQAFGELVSVLKDRRPPRAAARRRGPRIELAFGPGDRVLIRESGDPSTVVTTTQEKWDVFVRGVRAGEFDHFVRGRAVGTRS
ncbi:DUF397 domain-containing protein [Streptomyces fructofermentans]|uniref:DUF397 domain-containing protein n=1 Tax=Streptomyces fructofermentans TaxID=152141 RepID=UPI0034070AE8